MSLEKCPLCDLALIESRPDSRRRWVAWCHCARCGQFGISDRLLITKNERFASVRVLLSGIVREYRDAESESLFREPFPEIITEHNFETIAHSRGVPTTPPEQLERLLLAIGKQTPYLGESTGPESLDVWAARAFVPTAEHASSLLGVVKKKEWITETSIDGKWSYRMTMEGLEEYYELARRSGQGDQCFIAMWYQTEVLDICKKFILPAVEQCGFKPYLVGVDPQDDRIDNKIIAEIRRSRFMIADLTGVRGGVYYEAGYAQGLGRPVMWCCHESWRTNVVSTLEPNATASPDGNVPCDLKAWKELVHFDVRQFPFNFWSTGEEWRNLTISWIESRRHVI